jgi:hypothetical protein
MKDAKSGFWMDTRFRGNLNSGHEFRGTGAPNEPHQQGVIGRGFTNDERMEIIEYLKIHKDSPDSSERIPPDCLTMMKLH